MSTNSNTEQRNHVCYEHDKKCFTTRDQAKRAIRQLHDKGMREYRCDVNPAFWHVGHLPYKVRRGRKTADQHYGRPQAVGAMTPVEAFYSSPPGADQPLTFRPSPANIRSRNGSTPAVAPTVVDNSIETLLTAAETSNVDAAVKLAGQIRDLLAQLVREVRIGQQERALEAQIAELESQRDKAIAALRDLRGEPEPEPTPGGHHWAGLKQSEMRSWARANGFEVPIRGSIPKPVVEAYVRARGGAR